MIEQFALGQTVAYLCPLPRSDHPYITAVSREKDPIRIVAEFLITARQTKGVNYDLMSQKLIKRDHVTRVFNDCKTPA